MGLSFIQAMGDGSTREFAVPFPYLSRTHVTASVAGVSTTFTWLNASLIQLASAPALGVVVDIRRATPNVTNSVDFSDGSTLTEEDLDGNARQLLFIAQEAFDRAATSVTVGTGGSFDGLGRRFENLGVPVNPGDAVTKEWAETDAASSVAQARQAASEAVATVGDRANRVLGNLTNPLTARANLGVPAAIKSDAAGGDYQTAPSIIRTIASVLDELAATPEDEGAVGDGIATDTSKVAAIFAANAGGDVFLPNRYKTGSLTVPRRTAAYGQSGSGIVPWTESWYAKASTLRLTGTASVTLSASSRMSDLLLVRDGLVQPADTVAKVRANKALQVGTAVKATGYDASDTRIERCSIFGHDLGIDVDGTDGLAYGARFNATAVHIDCTNGVRAKNVPDVGRLKDIHCWPFPGYIPGVSPTDAASFDILQQTGTAFHIEGSCDWFQAQGCFSYGYKVAVKLVGTSNVQLIDHQADHVGYGGAGKVADYAYRVEGNGQTNRMVNCTTISYPVGISLDCSGALPSSGRVSLSVLGGLFVSTSRCFDLIRGKFEAIGPNLQAASQGIYVRSTMGDATIHLGQVGAKSTDNAKIGTLLTVETGYTGYLELVLPDTADGYDVLYSIPADVLALRRVTIRKGTTFLLGGVKVRNGELNLYNELAGTNDEEYALIPNADGSVALVGRSLNGTASVELMRLRRSGLTPLAPYFNGLGNFADDTAAATGGVPVGCLYHNNGVVRLRRT